MPIRGSPNGARHTPPQAGRDRPEWVVAINRYARSQSIGTAGRNGPVRADRLGRTPAHTLVNEAISPDAIRLTVEAGVRITADLAVQPDQFGCSIVDSARVRGTEFVEALDALLVVDEGAP